MARAMTITEKILASHADLTEVSPGDLITAKIDLALANDITAPVAIEQFDRLHLDKVFMNDRVALIPSHFTPAKDIKSAECTKKLRDFSRSYHLENFFELGKSGIEHVLLPEQGLVGPGDLIVGADSHTCTYGALGAFSTGMGSTDIAAVMAIGESWFKVPESMKFIFKGKPKKWIYGKDLILHVIGDIGVDGALYKAMEFCGPAIDALSMDDRFTITNMAIEAGAKSGIIAADHKTKEYVHNRFKREAKYFYSDEDAEYSFVREYDISDLEPVIALPHSPDNTKPISEVKKMNIKIDQASLGSCTNGRLSDFKVIADIIKGNKIHKDVRVIIFPGSQQVYLDALREGIWETLIEAGAVVSTPTCGPCLGGHMGVLASGERAISTTNRNFVGRMGHPKSEVYLSNPAVAAASAIAGYIISPEDL